MRCGPEIRRKQLALAEPKAHAGGPRRVDHLLLDIKGVNVSTDQGRSDNQSAAHYRRAEKAPF